MKRIFVAALATGAVALTLAGCGQSKDEGTDANGLRKGTPGTSQSATSAARPTGTGTTGAPAATTGKPGAAASQTTCGEFKKLDTEAEKALIEKILAENPGNPFENNPHAALGTAKLVCLAGPLADTPVAVAAGIVEKK